VALEARGAPILTATCYCESCRKFGEHSATLAEAPAVLGSDGGTPFVLYRKDRVTCVRGSDALREHRLTPDSSTRRMIAACCGAPMVLDFTKGHWLTLYRDRMPAPEQPPLDMRVMTEHRSSGAADAADAIPSFPRYPGRFMWRLIRAWAAMGFRKPTLSF
jgi:hypothetical protein